MLFLLGGHGEVDGTTEQAAKVAFVRVQRQRDRLFRERLEPVILVAFSGGVWRAGERVSQIAEKTTALGGR